MPSRELVVRHTFGGGWATDFGQSINVGVSQDGSIELPFLNEVQDAVFELDGAIHKVAGTAKVNSSALESGSAIKGVFDAWLHGSAGAPSQHRIVHVGTTIKKDDADGSFSNIFTGLEADKVPSYAMLNDLVLIASDSNADVPKSWDGTTGQNLAGSPPNFAWVVEHKNRAWAGGVASAPSTLYYSVLDDPEDWVGSGSGSIVISNDDGDRLTGAYPFRDDLFVFKGPYKGSIHRITGSSPTGTDAFARRPFVSCCGAASPNAIFPFREDLGFLASDGTVRSLRATAAFGDFEPSHLSLPINSWLRDNVNRARIGHSHAVDIEDEGRVYISVPTGSNNNPTVVLVMDYRFDPVRWSRLPSFKTLGVALANGVDASATNRRIILGGGSDGFLRKFGQKNRSIDNDTALSYKWVSPYLTYGVPFDLKTLRAALLSFTPHNSSNVTFGWQRDNNAEDTVLVSQAGPDDVLGPASAGNDFTLDTSKLGGGRFIYQPTNFDGEGGSFRSVAFSATMAELNKDVEIHDFYVAGKVTGRSMETA